MRPSLLAAALLAAVTLPASPASASECVAWAEPPQANGGQVRAEGFFSCGTPRTGMTVTVCVDVLDSATWSWTTFLCDSATAPGAVLTASHYVWACAQQGPLVRTSVTGTNADGDVATATSLPALPGVGSCGP